MFYKKITYIFISCLFFSCAQASFLQSINEGMDLYNQENYKQAQTFFNNYIISNPKDEFGYYWLGKTYKKLDENNYIEANKNFLKAYEIVLEKRNLEKIYFNLEKKSVLEDYFDMAQTYFEAGKYDKASKYADFMLKIYPNSSLAYFLKAKVEYTKGIEDKAREYLNQAIMYNNEIIKTNLASMLKIYEIPDTVKEVYYNKAIEEYNSGNIYDCKNYLEKYLELDNSNVEVWNLLADISFNLGDLDLVSRTIEEVSKNNPNNIQNLVNQAKLYRIRNEKEKIEPVLSKAYKINPNNKELLKELGDYYLNQEDYKNSKKYYRILISIDENYYEAYFNYIYSLIQLKELDNALIEIRKVNKLNPKTSEIQYLLSLIAMFNAQFNEAKGYILSAIQKENNLNYYLELAKLNYTLSNHYESIENLEYILENLDNNFNSKEETYAYLVLNYLKLNDEESFGAIQEIKNNLDKNGIIYKYILYKLCKIKNNKKELSSHSSQIRKIKPDSCMDYIELSEFYYEEVDISSSIKIINEGIKKYPNSTILYLQKLKLYYRTNNNEKIQELIKQKN